MNDEELVYHYPRLYHMAAKGSWPSIRQHGLLTTSQLVDLYEAHADVRERVLGQRRPKVVTLHHPVHGDAVIRDQAPLRDQFLAASLTDLTASQWLDILNERVFFWLHPDKLAGLLGARRYKNEEHDVLTVDTASLLAAHRDQVRLSALNSGATLYPNAAPRGSETFQTVENYPWRPRRKQGPVNGITELAVIGGVPDIINHVVRVERRRQDQILDELFARRTSVTLE